MKMRLAVAALAAAGTVGAFADEQAVARMDRSKLLIDGACYVNGVGNLLWATGRTTAADNRSVYIGFRLVQR